jgi:hypothetical protein
MSSPRFALPVLFSVLFATSVPELRHVVLTGAGIAANQTGAGRVSSPVEPDLVGPVNRGADPGYDAVAERVEISIAGLAERVTLLSHPEALRQAFQAYHNYRAAHPLRVTKPYLYFVDFGLDSATPRGYVFDMDALTVVEGPFTVAHGRGSSAGTDIPTRFSNEKGSNATSLGLYLAQETYDFRGRSGGRSYSSVGLRLQGVSGRFNNAARTRGIVVHGAPYVSPLGAGRSEGCPAMTEPLARKLLPRLANGGMVFHYSPRDVAWLREDPWINSNSNGRLASTH